MDVSGNTRGVSEVKEISYSYKVRLYITKKRLIGLVFIYSRLFFHQTKVMSQILTQTVCYLGGVRKQCVYLRHDLPPISFNVCTVGWVTHDY